MTLTVNYKKRKNTQLFTNMQKHNGIKLSNLQNYIPIYKKEGVYGLTVEGIKYFKKAEYHLRK